MPKHKVILAAYFIDRYEISNAQYKDCVKAKKCEKPNVITWYDNVKYAKHPVVTVDWKMANAYCKWVGKRLPTEAEWEKAARGKQDYIWPWGNTWDENKCNSMNYNGALTSQMANIYEGRGTIQVGSLSDDVSPYGVMDMAGNVWEWVSDWYDEDFYKKSPENNPKGPENGEGKVSRGGSWWVNDPSFLRGASRFGVDPANGIEFVGGFRCAMEAE